MKLVVFGASGNCGRHFVKLGAAHGHRVTAVIRDGRRADALATVALVRGNVLDPTFVASTLRGQGGVMSGLGMRYRHPWSARESPDDFISRDDLHRRRHASGGRGTDQRDQRRRHRRLASCPEPAGAVPGSQQ